MNDQTQNIRVEKTLSDDKQFQEQLAAEIEKRIAYQAQDAWLKHLQDNSYPDYTIDQLGKKGFQWRLNWMVRTMSQEMARITATLTDLLGVANDLRELSKAESVDEMSGIFKTIMGRPAFKKQAG